MESVTEFWSKFWNGEESPEHHDDIHWLRRVQTKLPRVTTTIDAPQLTPRIPYDAVRGKKNWTTPDPDGVYNFWVKNLTAVYPVGKSTSTDMPWPSFPSPTSTVPCPPHPSE